MCEQYRVHYQVVVDTSKPSIAYTSAVTAVLCLLHNTAKAFGSMGCALFIRPMEASLACLFQMTALIKLVSLSESTKRSTKCLYKQ